MESVRWRERESVVESAEGEVGLIDKRNSDKCQGTQTVCVRKRTVDSGKTKEIESESFILSLTPVRTKLSMTFTLGNTYVSIVIYSP